MTTEISVMYGSEKVKLISPTTRISSHKESMTEDTRKKTEKMIHITDVQYCSHYLC